MVVLQYGHPSSKSSGGEEEYLVRDLFRRIQEPDGLDN